MKNRLYNCQNPYQGQTKKVLCLCSAGLLRSPTTAHLLSGPPWNYNTRCAGLDEGHALVSVDEVLIKWADEILVMTQEQLTQLFQRFQEETKDKTIKVLNIEDNYAYRDPVLIQKIKEAYGEPEVPVGNPKEV